MRALSVHRRRPHQGFSLVELMVAMAVGLIVALAVIGTVLSLGRQSSMVASTAAAQGSAQVGMSLMDASARMAGAGFYNNGQRICTTWNAWNGTAVVGNGSVFMPARIVAGGANTASDQVIFTGAQGSRSPVGAPVLDTAVGAVLRVSQAGGWALGDYAVVGVPGSAAVPCTLFEVTQAPTVVSVCGGNAPSCQQLVRNPSSTLNPVNNTYTSEPTYGFAELTPVVGPSVVSRVGSATTGFRQDAFAVQCGALVRYNAFSGGLPGCTSSPLSFGTGVDALVSDVVMMRAQYGISATAASDVVTSWVNATGTTWAAPSIADVARIKAIRVVMVVRAKEPGLGAVTNACTNEAGVVNTGPCSFHDAAAPVIDLSAVPVPAGRTWNNYRYRVQKAIMPLRTVLWSNP